MLFQYDAHWYVRNVGNSVVCYVSVIGCVKLGCFEFGVCVENASVDLFCVIKPRPCFAWARQIWP